MSSLSVDPLSLATSFWHLGDYDLGGLATITDWEDSEELLMGPVGICGSIVKAHSRIQDIAPR